MYVIYEKYFDIMQGIKENIWKCIPSYEAWFFVTMKNVSVPHDSCRICRRLSGLCKCSQKYCFPFDINSRLFTLSYWWNGRERIVFGSDFQNGDFDEFTRFPYIPKSYIYLLVCVHVCLCVCLCVCVYVCLFSA